MHNFVILHGYRHLNWQQGTTYLNLTQEKIIVVMKIILLTSLNWLALFHDILPFQENTPANSSTEGVGLK